MPCTPNVESGSDIGQRSEILAVDQPPGVSGLWGRVRLGRCLQPRTAGLGQHSDAGGWGPDVRIGRMADLYGDATWESGTESARN